MSRQPLSWALALVALHSLVLGAVMLVWPLGLLSSFGWEFQETRFYPAQSGLFLLILGIVYAVAVRQRGLVWIVVLSKAFAVTFLLAEAWRGTAPPILFLTAALDACMGAVIALAWRRERRMA